MTAWSIEPLEDCLDVLIDYRGKSPTKSLIGIPVLSAKVVKTTGLLHPIEQTIAPEYYPKWMTRGLPSPGDVVMTTEAPLGEVIQLDEQTATFALGQRIVCLRGKKDKLDNTFLRYLLTSPQQQALLEARATGTTVLGISQKTLRSMPISFPEIAEQRRIGALLAGLDDKIELNRRMSETLEAMARALFRDWFVDFGPTRAKMAGKAPYLSPALWDLFPATLDDEGKPEGWEFQTVIDQADWVNGAAYKNMHFSDAADALPVIKIAELKNGVTGQTQRTATNLGPRYLIDDGELLFSWSGNPDTSIDAFVWSGGKGWLNQHIFAVRGNGSRSKPYLHAMLKFLMPDFAELARNKQTTGLGHVTKADMQRMLICTAPKVTHDAFDQAVSPLFDRAYNLTLETRTLAQTRDLLLPRLMSGELRVADLDHAEKEPAA